MLSANFFSSKIEIRKELTDDWKNQGLNEGRERSLRDVITKSELSLLKKGDRSISNRTI
jgi:hypothetical protein